MKKIKTMRLASVLLIAVLLSTCVISGTFAKYASTVAATDSAVVAQFTVKSFDTTGTVADQTVDVDIFSTIYDTKGTTDYTTETTTEADVTEAGKIIAPGTWGKYTYAIENDSQVTVAYAIAYTAQEKDVPLEWSIDGTNWKDNIADLNDNGTIAIGGADVSVTVYWRWAIDKNTVEADTALGLVGSTIEPNCTITVSFEQVD